MTHRTLMKLAGSIAAGVLAASSIPHALAQQAKTPSAANESAPARSTLQGQPHAAPGSRPVYPSPAPGAANESAPARTGAASTPTGGQGQSAYPAVGATEPLNRLPRTASSVSESAPARTGPATVPTARFTRMWDEADANNDGVVDRFEFDRWVMRQPWSK